MAWGRSRVGTLVLCTLILHSLASSAVGQPATASSSDVLLGFAPPRWYNPSVIGYSGRVFCAIKLTDFKKVGGKVWWLNSIQMCAGNSIDSLQELQCEHFQPWDAQSTECELGPHVRGGKVDSQGLGDTKMWAWPGKGIYAIFGQKPRIRDQPEAISGLTDSVTNSSRYCSGQLVYHQWLVQVWSDPDQSHTDEWRLVGQEPRPLLPDTHLHQYPTQRAYVMEKNWMPWIYKDPESGSERVMVTYMVMPHTVWELMPSGLSVPRWTTSNDVLFAKFASFDVHGGPPVVWVPPHLTQDNNGQGYYLGVMHHIERLRRGQRLYRHFAFKFAPSPPFQVTHISDELPLHNNMTHKGRVSRIAFVCGLHLDTDTGLVYISYGAADAYARLLTLHISELERLFTGNIVFRDMEGASDSMGGAR